MRWHEIDYLCHGLVATVVSPTDWDLVSASSVPRITRRVGIIDCPRPSSIPKLVVLKETHVYPGDSLVILREPA